MSRLRVGLIGLGPGSEPHAKSLHDLAASVEVVAAASRTEAACTAFHGRFGFPVTTDIDGVIAHPSIAAMLVLPPRRPTPRWRSAALRRASTSWWKSRWS